MRSPIMPEKKAPARTASVQSMQNRGKNAKEWSDFLTGAAGLIGDPATRTTIQGLTNAGLAPLVKVLLEGTAKSKIEHYSIIGSNAVSANQRIPTNGMTPSLLNGFRPYGTNSVNVSLVID